MKIRKIEKIEAPRVIVSTWQSALNINKEWFSQFGMYIGDEAHLHKAKSLTEISNRLINAKYRIGTTGTIDNLKINKLVLIGNFGPVFRVISTKKLMDSDTLAQLKISCLVLNYTDDLKKIVSKAEYKQEIDFLVAHKKRNKFITNLASDLKGNTLVLFNYVKNHGIPLYEQIKEAVGDKKKVFYVAGSVDTEERERIRFIIESETNAIIAASSGTFSVGINIKNLHNIIFAAPNKSQIRILQSIGRGLRKSDDGRPTNVYDISDDLSWKKKKNYTLNHAIERVRIYDSESFDYKMYKINI